MKVGILTFHGANNYGAVLQVYGLKKICESIGYSVHVIDYAPRYISKQYNYFSVSKDLKLNFIKLRNVFGNIQKKRKFDSFRQDNFDIEPFHKGSYDAILYGSDQIWNPDITIGFDPVFFGVHKIEALKRISYAASFGKQALTFDEMEQLKTLLKHLDIISVREESAMNMLMEITEKPISVTLDPALLLPWETWLKTVHFKNGLPAEYILVYEVYKLPETLKTANELAQKTGLPIVELAYYKTRFRVPHIQLNNIGPAEFLGLINHAKYIVTSSFHGTAFSIIFRKNFYTTLNHIYGARISDLLGCLSLHERIVIACPDHIENINYNEVEKKLNKLREYSIEYIKNAVEGNAMEHAARNE